MAENTYWFARRFPLSDPRNSMAPVTPEGFRVAWAFVWWMVGGAVAWLVLGALAAWNASTSELGPLFWVLAALGPIIFIGCAIYGATLFIRTAIERGDKQHTVDDYKAGRVR